MRCPRMSFWSSRALLSMVRPSRTLGMTRKCVGATGAMSLKARHLSSWYTMLAGIVPSMILSNMVGAPVSPWAAAALAASASEDMLLVTWRGRARGVVLERRARRAGAMARPDEKRRAWGGLRNTRRSEEAQSIRRRSVQLQGLLLASSPPPLTNLSRRVEDRSPSQRPGRVKHTLRRCHDSCVPRQGPGNQGAAPTRGQGAKIRRSSLPQRAQPARW
mmetsp:Transcript_17075/g.54461  ORF Transcript_17075/g.54461 Transcript_17075/m.54461 type:complete len:218 (+) Transcript_17075:112-765(+)